MAAVMVAGSGRSWCQEAPAPDEGPEAARLESDVALAVETFKGRSMTTGLARLEELVALHPDSEAALRAYAYALVRSGRFADAERALLRLLGEGPAHALQSGETTVSGMSGPLEAEDVLGLAIVRAEQSAYREADRLYKAYSDLVGPTTALAARAFWREADMFELSGVEWGDAAAARTRALALDPSIASASTLPAFPAFDQPTAPAAKGGNPEETEGEGGNPEEAEVESAPPDDTGSEDDEGVLPPATGEDGSSGREGDTMTQEEGSG